MLNSLRNSINSWFVKLLLGLLVLSFAVWGVADFVGGNLGDSVVTVGGTSVSPVEYRLAYNRQLSLLSQRFGRQIDSEQARALGIDNQVLGQLIAGAALDEEADAMGLGLSKDRLAGMIGEDPAFQGVNGQFSRSNFQAVLRNVGMREDDYIEDREKAAIRTQIIEASTDGMTVPEAFLTAYSIYENQGRTVEFVSVSRSATDPSPQPSAEDLTAFFEENRADYAAPEYRRLAIVKLESVDIADPAAIEESAVRADYESRIDRYSVDEGRRVEQIVFTNREEAEAARARLDQGATFDELIADSGRSAKDVQLGSFTREDLPDPALAETVFSLEEGQPSAVVDGAFGPVIVRVTEITPAKITPLEEVNPLIRSELALAQANEVLLDVHDAYEDSRAGGDTLEEAARKQGLDVRLIEAVDQTGTTPDGETVDDLPMLQELLSEAFQTEPGEEALPLSLGPDGFIWYEVTDVTQARERELEEVKAQVVADWQARQTDQALALKAEELASRLKEGATLDAIATELGAQKQVVTGLKRGASEAQLGANGVSAAFAVAKGGVTSAPGPDDDTYLVMKVVDVVDPLAQGDSAFSPETREALESRLTNDLLDQLVARLQADHEVVVNRPLIDLALRQ